MHTVPSGPRRTKSPGVCSRPAEHAHAPGQWPANETSGVVIPSPAAYVPSLPTLRCRRRRGDDCGRAVPGAARKSTTIATAAPALPRQSDAVLVGAPAWSGVSRIVIDAGRRPRSRRAVDGISESELTLDVAMRLSACCKSTRHEVVMTRDTDVFVPLKRGRPSPTRRRGPVPVDSRQCEPRSAGARRRDVLSEFRLESAAEQSPPARTSRFRRAMHSFPTSCARLPSTTKSSGRGLSPTSCSADGPPAAVRNKQGEISASNRRRSSCSSAPRCRACSRRSRL